ncbi:hypothetical protein CTU88_07900 [Streptomyces sp. JV178]|uniref:hypothetical protein n=1 Tax=Streptomyces sp. JV178 TaxID=858632 RepID=UPI000C1B0BBA|nr:hypothetical protein [Streptomyces sp. JV178]PIM73647.1 hypothetical protein CTU88_07900 [Streptomyces sp. JV178]
MSRTGIHTVAAICTALLATTLALGTPAAAQAATPGMSAGFTGGELGGATPVQLLGERNESDLPWTNPGGREFPWT